MSRRDQIRMDEAETAAFLREGRILNVATNSPSGRIHLVAMWYGFLPSLTQAAPETITSRLAGARSASDELAYWTYAKSQKILNLRRDPTMTGLIETGDSYDQLRGVELVGRGVLDDDPDVVRAVGESVWERYTGPVDDAARSALAVVGAKRIAVRFAIDTIVSWDHTKLGGRY